MTEQTKPQSVRELRRIRAQADYQIANLLEDQEAATLQRQEARDAWKQETLAKLDVTQTLLANGQCIRDLSALLDRKAEAGARLRAARSGLEDCKQTTMLNLAGERVGPDGKAVKSNAEMRAAELADTLRRDPLYQEHRLAVEQADRDLDDANARIQVTQAEIDTSRARLRLLAATLEFLAS